MPTALEILKSKGQQNTQGLSAIEILKSKGAEVQKPQEKKPGLFQGFVQDVARPFLKTAVTTEKAGRGLFGIVTGDIEQLKKAGKEEEFDFGYFGKVKPIGQGKTMGGALKEAGGVGLEIASYFPATAGVKGALGGKAGLKEAVKQGAKIGAKEGAFGGALYGAGEAAEEEKGLDEIIAKGAIGAGVGTAFGAGVGATIPIA